MPQKVTTQTVIDVVKYKAFDGTLFDTQESCDDYERRKKGTRITCPECKGKRRVNIRKETVRDELHFEYVEIETGDTCQKCHGKGYLDLVTKWV